MKIIRLLVMAVVLGCGAVLLLSLPLYAQLKGAPVPFAADWANYEDGERQENGKYYASGEGIRLEGMAGGEPFVMIYNFKQMVAWNLIESERMYIETAIDSDDLGMYDFGHFGTPCPADARAMRSGSETVGGRRTETWTCTSADQGTMTVWYDTKLQAIIRSDAEDDRFELTNIKEGRQPASLFVPPSGYSKMDIPVFGMPAGKPQRDQQTGSMEEMMRSMMQEMASEPGQEQRGSNDEIQGIPESLREMMGR